MKKKYFLSMFSIFIIILLFDCVYFIYHQSLMIFLSLGFVHLILYIALNSIGAHFLFKPIEILFETGLVSKIVKDRINRLTLLSSLWIFFIGNIYIFFTLFPLYFFPDMFKNPEDFVVDKIPPEFFFFSILPAIYFIYALFPSFIAYFILNDFNLNLKEEVFQKFQILYIPKKNQIGVTLSIIFTFLVLLPSMLVILELKMASEMQHKYPEFTSLNPLETVLIDRFVLLIGMVIAVFFITRSFTKPIHSLLKEMGKVREGDFSTQAAVITQDEIGLLTREFNRMVDGLKERELIRDTFGKYVTNDIATVILEKKIDLEGVVRTCTILVTDIENYTSISEDLSPKEIVMTLNDYFSAIVSIIQEHKGVVNKFIGDSVFAMFNVPLDDPDHAIHAIRAAQAIEKITLARTFGKNRQLTTRIGINTGTIVAGNIGSTDRIEYTVIGDAVNIAARLEQLNKEYGTHILLGEETYSLAKDHFNFVEIGNVQLKGKEKSVKIFKLGS